MYTHIIHSVYIYFFCVDNLRYIVFFPSKEGQKGGTAGTRPVTRHGQRVLQLPMTSHNLLTSFSHEDPGL